ncbi:MAG: hypothetical protein ACKVOU_01780 [Cytophagales bacterium]
MENIFVEIKKNAPLGFNEFRIFIDLHYQQLFKTHNLELINVPFEMILGFFIVFFEENQIEFTIGSTQKSIILVDIVAAFDEFEKVIGHFS